MRKKKRFEDLTMYILVFIDWIVYIWDFYCDLYARSGLCMQKCKMSGNLRISRSLMSVNLDGSTPGPRGARKVIVGRGFRFMVEFLLFPQIRLPSVKILRKQMSSHPCKHQNMHSRDLQSPYGFLLKKKNQIKLVTEQTFHSLLPQH